MSKHINGGRDFSEKQRRLGTAHAFWQGQLSNKNEAFRTLVSRACEAVSLKQSAQFYRALEEFSPGITNESIHTLQKAGLIEAIYSRNTTLRDELLQKYTWLLNKRAPGLIGDTPLLAAVRIGDVDCVEYLIAKRAPLNTVNRKGETALQLAQTLENQTIIQLLQQQATTSKNHSTNSTKAAGTTKIQKSIKTDPPAAANNNRRAQKPKSELTLHQAARNGDVASVKRLLNENTSPKAVNAKHRGYTPLDYAVDHQGLDSLGGSQSRYQAAILLLENGAQLSKVKLNSKHLANIMCKAVVRKDFDALKTLIARGFNLSSPNHKGKTPVDILVKTGQSENLRALCQSLPVETQNKVARQIAIGKNKLERQAAITKIKHQVTKKGGFELGFGGSRHSISIKGHKYPVPRRIKQIYQMLTEKNAQGNYRDWSEVSARIDEVITPAENSKHFAFFNIGKRFESTNTFLDKLKTTDHVVSDTAKETVSVSL